MGQKPHAKERREVVQRTLFEPPPCGMNVAARIIAFQRFTVPYAIVAANGSGILSKMKIRRIAE
jgi:hypothetical protein